MLAYSINISLNIVSDSVILSTLTSVSWPGRITGIQWDLTYLIHNILNKWVYLILSLLSIQGKIYSTCQNFIIFLIITFMIFSHFILVSFLGSWSSFFTSHSIMPSLVIMMAMMFSFCLFIILFILLFLIVRFPIFEILLFVYNILKVAWSKNLMLVALIRNFRELFFLLLLLFNFFLKYSSLFFWLTYRFTYQWTFIFLNNCFTWNLIFKNSIWCINLIRFLFFFFFLRN